MGCSPSYPITRSPLLFEPRELFNIAGEKRKDVKVAQNDEAFKEIQMQYWSHLIEDREKASKTRRKFQELGEEEFKELCEKFPGFEVSDIMDLKLQYQTFDINQDGIIDFPELMQVLDDIGDTSDMATRESYFKEIDIDHSGAIDFEEFLAVIHKLKFTDTTQTFGTLGSLWQRDTENIRKVRKLSVAKQMLAGLF